MILNNFDPNITFNNEIEKDCKSPFLDVLLFKKGSSIVTIVYHKETTNDVYFNWKSFAPFTWKRGTLKTLVDQKTERIKSSKESIS